MFCEREQMSCLRLACVVCLFWSRLFRRNWGEYGELFLAEAVGEPAIKRGARANFKIVRKILQKRFFLLNVCFERYDSFFDVESCYTI